MGRTPGQPPPPFLPPHSPSSPHFSLDHFGKGLAIVRSDVGGNIDRLDRRWRTDPARFAALVSIPRAELAAAPSPAALDGTSDAKGLLWLVRAQLFVAALLRGLEADTGATVADAARAAYAKHLRPYHGFITSSAFTVALTLAPSRRSFFDAVGGGGEAVALAELGPWLTTWEGVLGDVLAWLDGAGLNDPCKV